LRHTAAMTLLHAGVDTSVIALWLGHQSPVTTHIYLHELSGIASGGRVSAGWKVRDQGYVTGLAV
ncbi:MAG TPA: tyrosine-type recombinase/integrase, partial [Mycobacterium sp.]|nr:tyrosine-type recombinase/integrase [Mycobacterium sp.]